MHDANAFPEPHPRSPGEPSPENTTDTTFEMIANTPSQPQQVSTIVIGAGLSGLAGAIAMATKYPGRAVIVEAGTRQDYRNETSSQGDLRGSRVIEQSPELTKDIRATWDFMAGLEARHGLPIMIEPGSPYLMLVKSRGHLERIRIDLKRKDSPFTEYTLPEARAKFGLNLPGDYAAVVDTHESRRLDISNYITAMKREMMANGGEVHYETTLLDYVHRLDGRHQVRLSNGREYLADHFIIAAGTGVARIVHELHAMHSSHAGHDVAEEVEIPCRFLQKNSVSVPQRTLHYIFREGTKVDPVTLYFLDCDHHFDGHDQIGALGFYMFPEMDGQGLKIGYDPMPNTVRDESNLQLQEEAMEHLVLELYNLEPGMLEIRETHNCSYPVDIIHSPCAGVSKFHNIGFLANPIGYGAMAGFGMAMRVANNTTAPESPYHPDILPGSEDQARFTALYGPHMRIPRSPSFKAG